jgi:hypothetical protein
MRAAQQAAIEPALARRGTRERQRLCTRGVQIATLRLLRSGTPEAT